MIAMRHVQAEFREANFFAVMIFCSPNRFSDSVRDAESHDIKILTEFPGNPILEILIKFCNCVGGNNMRGYFQCRLLLVQNSSYITPQFIFDKEFNFTSYLEASDKSTCENILERIEYLLNEVDKIVHDSRSEANGLMFFMFSGIFFRISFLMLIE